MLIFQYKGFCFYSEILLLMEMCWTELTDLLRRQHVVSASVDIKRTTTVIAKNYCIVWCSFLFMWGYTLLIMYSSKEFDLIAPACNFVFLPKHKHTCVFAHANIFCFALYSFYKCDSGSVCKAPETVWRQKSYDMHTLHKTHIPLPVRCLRYYQLNRQIRSLPSSIKAFSSLASK